MVVRAANRLVHFKEWQDRSCKFTWILFLILIAVAFVFFCLYPMASAFLYNEDDPIQTAKWSHNVASYIGRVWNIFKYPIFSGIALFVCGVISSCGALLAYRAEKRKTIEAPGRVDVMNILIYRLRNKDLGYHQGVEIILRDFGIFPFYLNIWPTWQPFIYRETTEIWNKFCRKFEFKTGNVPAIKEPTPSVTYNINDLFDYLTKYSNLQECLLAYFRHTTSKGDWVYALDWQDDDEDGYGGYIEGHKFYPHVPIVATHFTDWPIELLPAAGDRNYYAFLDTEFNNGVFWNPIEATMCIFGDELISEVNMKKPIVLNAVFRFDGTKK